MAETTELTPEERKKARDEKNKEKRAARNAAPPKAKRTTPRGSNKQKLKKLSRGQSKR